MSSGNVFVMAGGTGITNPYLNTIEKKISKDSILSALELENIDNKNILNEICEAKEESFSIWGYSENDNNLKKNPPESGDVIFITNNNAAIYITTVFKVIESKELDYIWAGRQSWKYKVILKNVVRVFIPYPVHVNINKWCAAHPFSPGLSSISNILNVYEAVDTQLDFRYIIGDQLRTGPIQGALKASVKYKLPCEENMRDIDIVFERLGNYCMLTHFECIIKEI